jgi:hypothetical protein
MSEHHDTETGEVFEPVGSYRRSSAIAELFTALAKAQGQFQMADRAGENEAFKRGGKASTYATLASALEATKEGRSANGLALVQIPSNGAGNNISVTTILGHSSGQWLESTFSVAPLKFDAQGAGSVVTYLRRYAAMAILGIAPEDDDGNAAVQQPNAQQGVTRTAAPRPTNAATHPVTSVGASPNPSSGIHVLGAVGPSSTGNGARPKWITDFLARKSYEIDPEKAGGWSAFEKAYCAVADAADDFDQLMKLDDDNVQQCVEFSRAVKPAVYNRFREHVKVNAKRLAPAPFVDQADAERVFDLGEARSGEIR